MEPITQSNYKIGEYKNYPLAQQLNNFLAVIEKRGTNHSGMDGLNTLKVIDYTLATKTKTAVKPETLQIKLYFWRMIKLAI